MASPSAHRPRAPSRASLNHSSPVSVSRCHGAVVVDDYHRATAYESEGAQNRCIDAEHQSGADSWDAARHSSCGVGGGDGATRDVVVGGGDWCIVDVRTELVDEALHRIPGKTRRFQQAGARWRVPGVELYQPQRPYGPPKPTNRQSGVLFRLLWADLRRSADGSSCACREQIGYDHPVVCGARRHFLRGIASVHEPQHRHRRG